jgi:hypothetical protein
MAESGQKAYRRAYVFWIVPTPDLRPFVGAIRGADLNNDGAHGAGAAPRKRRHDLSVFLPEWDEQSVSPQETLIHRECDSARRQLAGENKELGQHARNDDASPPH